MRVQWTSDYEIGISVVDLQHQRIVQYINELYDALQLADNHDKVAGLIFSLVDYTLSHFAFEEALMEEAGFTDLTAHKITHSSFVKQVEVMQERFEQGEQVAQELADMLQSWLLGHIVRDDRDYSALVKARLLQQSTHDQHWLQRMTERFFGASR